MSLDDIAAHLDAAARAGRPVPQISAATPLSLEDAYAIQARSIGLRIARGEVRTGLKMGFTSKAKMVQMGVHDLIWGRLTDAMALENGGVISRSAYVHPRAEPEIAFRLARDLHANDSDIKGAVAAVAPALEIIDSRYEDFKFSLEDVVADNSSSSGYVLGAWQAPDLDISNLGVVLSVNGEVRQTGSTAAILGDPWLSLEEAVRLAGDAAEVLPAGSILLAGAATEAVALEPGDEIHLEADGFDDVTLRVEV